MPNRIYYRIEVTVYLSDPKFHSTHAPYALRQRVAPSMHEAIDIAAEVVGEYLAMGLDCGVSIWTW